MTARAVAELAEASNFSVPACRSENESGPGPHEADWGHNLLFKQDQRFHRHKDGGKNEGGNGISVRRRQPICGRGRQFLTPQGMQFQTKQDGRRPQVPSRHRHSGTMQARV